MVYPSAIFGMSDRWTKGQLELVEPLVAGQLRV